MTKKEVFVDKINLDDRQTVYLTAEAYSVKKGYHKAGDAVQRHPKQAEELIKKGFATEAKTKTTGGKK